VPGRPLTQSINITINSDIVEGNETLFVLLSDAVNATVSKARGASTIFLPAKKQRSEFVRCFLVGNDN
jgi:hypothetical protein